MTDERPGLGQSVYDVSNKGILKISFGLGFQEWHVAYGHFEFLNFFRSLFVLNFPQRCMSNMHPILVV